MPSKAFRNHDTLYLFPNMAIDYPTTIDSSPHVAGVMNMRPRANLRRSGSERSNPNQRQPTLRRKQHDVTQVSNAEPATGETARA
jgi:hypothetical protein